MKTMHGLSNMCHVKVSTNMNIVKAIILVWNILELMLFLHHDARSLPKRQGPINTWRCGQVAMLNRWLLQILLCSILPWIHVTNIWVKFSFAMIYLHNNWTFTLMGRSSVARTHLRFPYNSHVVRYLQSAFSHNAGKLVRYRNLTLEKIGP